MEVGELKKDRKLDFTEVIRILAPIVIVVVDLSYSKAE